MNEPSHGVLGPVERYYTAKLTEHGPTPLGVDWNGEASQRTRFEQLARVISAPEPFSVNDLGCGYGALFAFLGERFAEFAYSGVDISEAMIHAATSRFGADLRSRFFVGAACPEPADYTFASGVFNVRPEVDAARWRTHVLEILDRMSESSRRGFAFNCLTAYSDAVRMRPDLFYADPCALFDHCKRHYARNVALLHDYGLYEFTVIVRKNT